MAVRIEIARPLEQPRQHGALGERQVLGGLAKVAARRHIHAPGAAAEIGGVEVELENFVFAEGTFEPRRDDHFANFALVGDVLADQEILHHLLGDGRTALRPAGIGEIADEGADDAAFVDTVMLKETPVLGGDERLLHKVGNVGEGHPHPPVAGFKHLGKASALAVQHGAHTGKLPPLQLRRVGQIGGGVIEEVDHFAEIDDRLVDGLVLAELPIGDVEVGKIDAVEGLDIAAERLRIVERGRNQVVDVDRFDIESFAHMGTAIAQNLHHLRLILHPVEMGLERLRLGHHLTQRQRSRKNLDQNHADT